MIFARTDETQWTEAWAATSAITGVVYTIVRHGGEWEPECSAEAWTPTGQRFTNRARAEGFCEGLDHAWQRGWRP